MKARPITIDNPAIAKRTAQVMIGGEQYDMLFNNASLMRINDQFGSIDNLASSLDDNNPDGYRNAIWLVTLLCNQSIALHNFLNPEDKRRLLTEEYVGIVTLPYEMREFVPAIVTAITRGSKRDIESDHDDNQKNATAE